MNDLGHWASVSGVTVSPEAGKHRRTDARPALRVALVAKEMGRFAEFHHAAYAARWSEGRDLSQRDTLGALIEAAGMDAEDVLARADSGDIAQQLDKQTREAIERGVFGVPTLFVEGEMFWGNDRFEVVRHYLERAGQSR
jgi:2-hydroxychromene-2-carboxylate isomerase